MVTIGVAEFSMWQRGYRMTLLRYNFCCVHQEDKAGLEYKH
jgi:hypothetical protein